MIALETTWLVQVLFEGFLDGIDSSLSAHLIRFGASPHRPSADADVVCWCRPPRAELTGLAPVPRKRSYLAAAPIRGFIRGRMAPRFDRTTQVHAEQILAIA